LRAWNKLRFIHLVRKRFAELMRREIHMGADLGRSPGAVQ
jgi:hypothetical protein